jgi:hypothetical protein
MISGPFLRVCALALGLAVTLPGCSGKGAALPYNDSNVRGYIGLCDKVGKPIRQGRVGDVPFVWKAVSSSPAPPPFDGYKKTATLYAYVPKPGYPPESWIGEQITESTFYTNPAHPMVQASEADGPVLKNLITGATLWNGLVQLRLFWSVPGEGAHTATYPATDIQVKGDRWTVVRGGDVACNSGSASTSTPPPPQATPTGGGH